MLKFHLQWLSFVVPGSESRVFVTFPRFRDGIPVTLGTRSAQIDSHGANLIDPFPNYSWHQNPTQDCANKMVSVFRVAVSVNFKTSSSGVLKLNLIDISD